MKITDTRPMRSRSLRLAAWMLLLMAATPAAQAQDAVEDFLRYGDLVYVEAAQMPSDSGLLYRMDIMIRIAYDYLVFVRSDRQHPDSAFTAGANVAIDVLNDRSATVYAKDEKTTLYAPDFATTNTRNAYLLLKHSVHLDAGEYTVNVTISDVHSTRERRIPLRIRLRRVEDGAIKILSALPVTYSPSFDSPRIGVLGFGGRFLFASPAFLGIVATAPTGTVWTFRLSRVRHDGITPVRSDTLPPFLTDARLSGRRRNGVVRDFAMDVYPGSLPESFHLFQLPYDTLEAGSFSLEIRASRDGVEDTLTFPFSMFWKDMPLTLKVTDIAIDIMGYILSAEEHAAMDRGSDEERMANILAYWKGRDPSPGTPYNEAMAEFFRRADQAYYKFQTTTVRNGALTDRGKIYILYGPPDTSERILEPGGLAQEVWSYTALGKKVRFVDRNRNGNLRLVQ